MKIVFFWFLCFETKTLTMRKYFVEFLILKYNISNKKNCSFSSFKIKNTK